MFQDLNKFTGELLKCFLWRWVTLVSSSLLKIPCLGVERDGPWVLISCVLFGVWYSFGFLILWSFSCRCLELRWWDLIFFMCGNDTYFSASFPVISLPSLFFTFIYPSLIFFFHCISAPVLSILFGLTFSLILLLDNFSCAWQNPLQAYLEILQVWFPTTTIMGVIIFFMVESLAFIL